MFRTAFAAILLVFGLTSPVLAELSEGDNAPGFTTRAALAGKEMGFSLKVALRNGPVVLYFYPKAFTQGCTLEANAFAEAMPDFRAAGASVVGLSNDTLETLKDFSREECRDAFPVGVASPALMRAYDVVSSGGHAARRTSYVIAPSGKITLVHSDSDYRDHVRLTLAAVRALSK